MSPTGQEKQPYLKLAGESLPAWLERARQVQAERDEKEAEAERQRIEKAQADFREWQGERVHELFALLDLLGIPAKFHDYADAGEAKVYTHKPTDEQVIRHASERPRPYAVIGNLMIIAKVVIWDIRSPAKPARFGKGDRTAIFDEYERDLQEWRDHRKAVTASFTIDYNPSNADYWQQVLDHHWGFWDSHVSHPDESPWVTKDVNDKNSANNMLRGDDLLVAFVDAIDVLTAKVQRMTEEYEAAQIVEGDTIPTPAELEAEQSAYLKVHAALEQALKAIAPPVENPGFISLLDDDSGDGQGVDLPLATARVLDALELAGYELKEMSDDE